MKMGSYIYNRILDTRGFECRIWRFIRRVYIKIFNDPDCLLKIHGKREILGPLSHELPFYLKVLKRYDQVICRVSDYLHNHSGGSICAIDVGANIGDTVFAIYQNENDQILAIEPNPKFFRYLEINTKDFGSIQIVDVVCSDQRENKKLSFDNKGGPASTIIGGTDRESKTLDILCAEYFKNQKVEFIKIDTDGYDFMVLKGAKKIIERDEPIVLFECDVFNNDEYLSDITEAFSIFKSCKYAKCIAYDHVGNLMGIFDLDEVESFKQYVFYQLTSSFYYFDLLMIPSKSLDLIKMEVNFFAQSCSNSGLRDQALQCFPN